MKETKNNAYNFSLADIKLIKDLLSLPEDHIDYIRIFETIYGQNMNGNMAFIKEKMNSVKRVIADTEFYNLLDNEFAKGPHQLHTAAESYEETKATNLGALQQQVFNLINTHPDPLSRNDIVSHTGLRINVVTARVRELIKMGKIRVQGTKIDKESKRRVSLVVVKV